MKELEKINKTIARKQIFRIGCSILGVVLGLVQLSKFMYQKGITDCQENLRDFFPEEYSAISEKVVESLEQ